MAQQDELQRRQITEAENSEQEARPIVTELRPRVEKLPAENTASRSKLTVQLESGTHQDSLPAALSLDPAKRATVLLEEKPAEPVEAGYRDTKYKPTLTVTEAINEHQIAFEGDASAEPEIVPAAIEPVTVEVADNSSTGELPDFLFTNGTEILPIGDEARPLPVDMIETDVLYDDEVVFDDEVIAAFEQLVGLINLEQEEATVFTPEPRETFVPDQIVFLNQAAAEPIKVKEIEPNAFAEFIITKPQPEQTPNIETIIAGANDQTLEKTCLQLSFYLAEATQEPDPRLKNALQDVLEAFHRDNVNYADRAHMEKPAVISPEFTQKLLILLRVIGYTDPQEALVEFIEQHDFEFLLQAVSYLHQLCDDNNQQELLPTTTLSFTATKINEALIVRLGQAIMQYFFMPKAVPQL